MKRTLARFVALAALTYALATPAHAATYLLLSQTNALAAGITNLAKTYTDAAVATVTPTQVTLTHAGTVTLDLTPLKTQADLVLTGAVTFATSNLAAGHDYTVFGRNPQSTNCTVTLPGWQFPGGFPAEILPGTTFALSLFSRGTLTTNVFAAFSP